MLRLHSYYGGAPGCNWLVLADADDGCWLTFRLPAWIARLLDPEAPR